MARGATRMLLGLLIGAGVAGPVFAADGESVRESTVVLVESPLGYREAAILGVVEGVTEFLPISSTGHLILANHLLGLDAEVQAFDVNGLPLWVEAPADGSPGLPLTVKSAADTYAIVIQVGAILAVALLYWRTILFVLAGLIGRNVEGLRLLRNLIVAFIPAPVLALLAEDFIDEHLFSVPVVAAGLIVGGIVMLLVGRWQRRKAQALGSTAGDPALADMTATQALFIGLVQCFSLWPGMSRSMVTIVGGYVVGLRPARAAEFSFLLGLPTLAGASFYKATGSGALALKAFESGPLLLGCLVAAVSAGLAVHWLVGYLTRHGLALFAWYRVALAVSVLIFLH